MTATPSRRELVFWLAATAALAVLDVGLLVHLVVGLLHGTLGPWQPAVGHLVGVTLLVACGCCGIVVNRAPRPAPRVRRRGAAAPGGGPPGRG